MPRSHLVKEVSEKYEMPYDMCLLYADYVIRDLREHPPSNYWHRKAWDFFTTAGRFKDAVTENQFICEFLTIRNKRQSA